MKLTPFAPLLLHQTTMPGRVVVQWDKDDCAALGLIKVDLLGLGMMAALKDSIQIIRDHYAEEVDLAHLPQNCPDVECGSYPVTWPFLPLKTCAIVRNMQFCS